VFVVVCIHYRIIVIKALWWPALMRFDMLHKCYIGRMSVCRCIWANNNNNTTHETILTNWRGN